MIRHLIFLRERDIARDFFITEILPIGLLRPRIPLTREDAMPARFLEAGTHPTDPSKEVDESKKGGSIGPYGANPKNLAQRGFHKKRNLCLAFLPT